MRKLHEDLSFCIRRKQEVALKLRLSIVHTFHKLAYSMLIPVISGCFGLLPADALLTPIYGKFTLCGLTTDIRISELICSESIVLGAHQRLAIVKLILLPLYSTE